MEKRTGVVTFAGGPITLVGPEIKVGQQAPDFTVLLFVSLVHEKQGDQA